MIRFFFFFFQAEAGIRAAQESRGLGDVYQSRASYDATTPRTRGPHGSYGGGAGGGGGPSSRGGGAAASVSAARASEEAGEADSMASPPAAVAPAPRVLRRAMTAREGVCTETLAALAQLLSLIVI